MSSNSLMQSKSTRHESHLPQEIIDKIIGAVDIDDLETLQSCALTCRAFLVPSQRLIFDAILFSPEDPDSAASQFRELIDLFFCNGKLASYIRELHVIVDDDLWNPFFANQDLIACLTQIRGSQSGCGEPFTLQLTSDLDEPKYYPVFHPPRNRAFETHFIPSLAPRITNLVIENMREVPIALFDGCRNLCDLVINDVTIEPFEEARRVPIHERPAFIRKLWFRKANDLICSLRLNHLSELNCFGSFVDDLPAVKHALQEATGHLEFLGLIPYRDVVHDGDRRYSSLRSFSFAAVPNLRRLHFYIPFATPGREDVAIDVAKFLDTIPLDHKIESIWISLHCHGGSCVHSLPVAVETHFREANWAALDEVLVKISSGGQRLEVQIELDYLVCEGEGYIRTRFGCPPNLAAVRKDLDVLDRWAPRFLPQASRMPNLVIRQESSVGYGYLLRSLLQKANTLASVFYRGR